MKILTPIAVAGFALAACSAETAQDTPQDTPKSTTDTAEAAITEDLCVTMGPQTPRDISNSGGLNTMAFEMAPVSTQMNLCNIHTHTNAEHKGPGFSVFVGDSDDGGYACNNTDTLTAEQLTPAPGAYGAVKPGDTIEVHWVHTSCDSAPGEGLGSCFTDSCTDPLLRVETQVFLVANDSNALDFTKFDYDKSMPTGKHQPFSLPSGTGTPVVFRGSTTGPSYTQSTCSPAKVTWSVRPQCAMVDINSLHRWAEMGNVFKEKKSHGVRQLVTAPELLSPIP